MVAATLSSKYQISIPKLIREELRIEAGQKFIFIRKGNVLMLVPQLEMHELRGALSGANTDNYREHKDRY